MSRINLDWLLRTSVPQAPPTIDGTQTQTITIFDEDCEVTAHKTGMATWKAYGYVQGRPIHATDESAPAAFSRWRNLAKAMLAD